MQGSSRTDTPAADTAAVRWVRSGRLLLVAGLAATTLVLLLHLGLLSHGVWGADEFQTFGLFRSNGWQYLWFRFTTWSPRPFSEALIALYAVAVRATGRPHLVPALAILWIGALLALLPALAGTRGVTRAWRGLGALTLLCLIILGRDVGDVFYWPFGGVAYAPVVIVAIALLFRYATVHGSTRSDRMVTALLLVVAAWTSEAGAMFVVAHAGLMAVWRRWRGERIGVDDWLPLLAGLAVFVAIGTGDRVAMGMLPGGDPARYHNLMGSLLAAAQRLLPEFISLDGTRFDGRHLLAGLIAKAAFFVGIQGCWMARDPTLRAARQRLPLLALAVPPTCFGILAASYHEFGLPCCERHAFLRQALWLVALAAIAIWTAPREEPERGWRALATPIGLLVALGLMLVPRVPALWRDYANFRAPAIARGLTWQSGHTLGPAMTLYQAQGNGLVKNQVPDHPHGCVEAEWGRRIEAFFPGKTCLRVVNGAEGAGARRDDAGRPAPP